jgi:hypothetical protein
MEHRTWKQLPWRIVAILCIVTLLIPASAVAGSPGQGKDDITAVPYDAIPYSEIAAKLHEIESNSNRVKVDVIGQSAGGRDLFLVTLSDPQAMGRLGTYQVIRKLMLTDPEKAQDMIEKLGDFKVPFFINASIHGTEYPGVDAAIKLIETLAYEDSEEVQAILNSVILLVNVVANPDGRALDTRENANGFDLNRDFVTQSQPETRAAVRVIADWNPMVLLDLHGFYNPMLIEPCTPPHNPNYEYDLFIKWALANALAMKAELYEQLGFEAQIPYLEDDLGWDDWAPSYTPMYAMFHGAYGHTLETSYHDERGVYADYAAVWGSLKFVAENKEGMIYDQIEIFRRGYLDLLQQPIPPELLPEYPQYEELMLVDFPAAYVIPAGPPFQVSQHQAARLVDFLLFNDVQVHQAIESFVMDGVEYPAGTYVVWMNQPKRGLANTILEDGLDLSDIPGLYFYSPPTVWSNARLWGADLAVMEDEDKIEIATVEIKAADRPEGSVEGGTAVGAYAYGPTSIAAIQATNALLADGVTLYRAEAPFEDAGRTFGAGTFILPADANLAGDLANNYGLEIYALADQPDGATLMRQQRIAVLVDVEGYNLFDRVGFEYDAISVQELNIGPDLTGYDVFVNEAVYLSYPGLSALGRKALQDFFDEGGDYVGLGKDGADLAQELGFMSFDEYNPPGNSIARIDLTDGDPVAAGFGEQGYVFVNATALFSIQSDDVEVAASLDAEDFFVSGYWPGWPDSGAAGKAVAIHKTVGAQDMTLIGFDAIFRAHPENGFRMVANAIYNGLEQALLP